MTRKELNDKIDANHEAIKKLRLENIELQKQEMLLSDDVQQYYEEEVEVVVKRRPKIVFEKQHRGIITWKEDFMDEDTGEVVTIQRNQVVRINGEWV